MDRKVCVGFLLPVVTERSFMNKIKTFEDRYNAEGIVSGHISDHMLAEITELRKEVERLTTELTLCKNVMFKAGVRLRGCGVSNYTIESVADSLDLYAKVQP